MEWIESIFVERYNKIVECVNEEWDKDNVKEVIDWFTPHGPKHNASVEKIVIMLSEPAKEFEFYPTPLERFILSAAAWLHDMGMCPTVYESSPRLQGDKAVRERTARRYHHILSADYVMGQDKRKLFKVIDLEGITPNVAEEIASTVAIVSHYHRRKEHLFKCPITRVVAKETVRVRLLAALLRLADGIHVSSDRCTNVQYQLMMMGPMPWESQFHWLKTFAVSEIKLDHNSHLLHVQIDIPQSYGSEYGEWQRISRSLGEYLRLELEEELEEVNKVLVMYKGYPTYWIVNYDPQEIPGHDLNRAKELKEVLNNKEIANSPNAGRVFDAVLQTLQSIIDADQRLYGSSVAGISPRSIIDTLKDFKIRFVDRFLEERACHVALRRVVKMLNTALNVPDGMEDAYLNSFRTTLNEIKTRCSVEIAAQSADRKMAVFSDIEYIYVFAYSSTVGQLLSALTHKKKNEIQIFVAECRPKSTYTFNNRPLYLDGVEYAKMLREKGLQKIAIIPDLEIATRLSRNPEFGDKSLVLFGANGYSVSTGEFGYSTGHLMLALVARSMDVRITVVTNSYKIGEFDPNPNLERGKEWFCTYRPVLDELDRYSINLLNLREDLIPVDFLDLLITEKDSILDLRLPAARQVLATWNSEWDRVFEVSGFTDNTNKKL